MNKSIILLLLGLIVIPNVVANSLMPWLADTCSSTASDYIFVDNTTDADGTAIGSHKANVVTNITLNYTAAQGSPTITGNAIHMVANDQQANTNFSQPPNGNITIEGYMYANAVGAGVQLAMGITDTTGATLNGCTMRYHNDGGTRAFGTSGTSGCGGACRTYTNTTDYLTPGNFYKAKVTSDLNGNCWIKLWNTTLGNEVQIVAQDNFADTGTSNNRSIFFFRGNSDDANAKVRVSNITAYYGDNCPSAPQGDTSAPVLSSINITSETPNIVNLDVSGEPAALTDITPTVNFRTDENAFCKIGNKNANWTAMNGTHCSSGENLTLTHTCTLSSQDQLQFPSDAFFLTCKDNTGNENSVPLPAINTINVSIPAGTFNLTLTLNQTATIQNSSFLATGQCHCVGLINCTYSCELDPEMTSEEWTSALINEITTTKAANEKLADDMKNIVETQYRERIILGSLIGFLFIAWCIMMWIHWPKQKKEPPLGAI